MNALPATLVSILVCYVTFGGSVPTPQLAGQTTGDGVTSTGTSTTTSHVQEKHQVISNSQVVSESNGYLVKVTDSQINDDCEAKLVILGNGINKTVSYPCGKAPVDIINQKNGLVVGSEWFSDQPNVLVHLSDNQCQKEVFTEKDGQTSSTSEPLSDQDCEKLRSKISELKKQQEQINQWLAHQQLAQQQQYLQLQQNLNHMFGNLFGQK